MDVFLSTWYLLYVRKFKFLLHFDRQILWIHTLVKNSQTVIYHLFKLQRKLNLLLRYNRSLFLKS